MSSLCIFAQALLALGEAPAGELRVPSVKGGRRSPPSGGKGSISGASQVKMVLLFVWAGADGWKPATGEGVDTAKG